MTPKKEGYAGSPTQPTFTPDKISNHSDLIMAELHRKTRLNGQSLAKLYQANMGSLDAFYRLLATVETSFIGEVRLTFLNSFFDETEANQEGGADEVN